MSGVQVPSTGNPGVDALAMALTSAMQKTSQPVFDQRSMGRPDAFSGKDGDWPTWTFVARPYLESLHPRAGELLDHSETATGEEVAFDVMNEDTKDIARKLYLTLVPGLKNKALNIAKRVPRNNGFALWRALVREYEPTVSGRHASMLMCLLSLFSAEAPRTRCTEKPWALPTPRQCQPNWEEILWKSSEVHYRKIVMFFLSLFWSSEQSSFAASFLH